MDNLQGLSARLQELIARCREGLDVGEELEALHDDIFLAHEELTQPGLTEIEEILAQAFHEAGTEHILALEALREFLADPADETHLERAQERLEEGRAALSRLDALVDLTRQRLTRPEDFGAG